MIEKRREKDAVRAETLRVFSYLDGELEPKDRAAFEQAMLSDASLGEQAASYRSLFTRLSAAGRFEPAADFRHRVLAQLAAPVPAWVRLGNWFLGGAPRLRTLNPLTARLDGARLTRRQSKALAAFLAADPDAKTQVSEWKTLFEELAQLPAFQPPEGFQDQVMAKIRAETVVKPAPVGLRLMNGLRGLWPRRRERLAALSGALFGPTAVVAGTAYLTLSNPLVTPSNLLSYLWAKGSTFVNALTGASFGSALETGPLAAVVGVLSSPALTGPVVALGLVAFGALTLVSGWILYTNLVKATPTDRSYVAA
ncbi:MAG: anti-sigma factor family protein [Longimicrobiales bacterium]